MAETLQEFLVSVKYGVDQPSLERFLDTMKRVATSVAGIAGQIAGLGIATVTLAQQMSDAGTKLYWMSQRTGESIANIEAMKYAFEGMGLAGEQAVAAIDRLNTWSHRMGPAGAMYLRSLGVTATDTSTQIIELGKRLYALQKGTVEYAIELRRLEQFGFDETTMLRVGNPRFEQELKDKRNIARAVWGGDPVKAGEEFGEISDKVTGEFSKMIALFNDLKMRFGMGLFKAILPELEKLNETFMRVLPQIKAFQDQILTAVPPLMHFLEIAIRGFGELLQLTATLIKGFHNLPEVLKYAVEAFLLLPKALELFKSPLFWMLAGLTALLLLLDDYQHWKEDQKDPTGKANTSHFDWGKTDAMLKGLEDNKIVQQFMEWNTQLKETFERITGIKGVFEVIEGIIAALVLKYGIPLLLGLAGRGALGAGGLAARGAVAGGSLVAEAVAVALASTAGVAALSVGAVGAAAYLVLQKVLPWAFGPAGDPQPGVHGEPKGGARTQPRRGGPRSDGEGLKLPGWGDIFPPLTINPPAPTSGGAGGPHAGGGRHSALTRSGGTQIASAGDDWASYIQQGMDETHKDDDRLYDLLKLNLEAMLSKLTDILDTVLAMARQSGAISAGVGDTGGEGGDGNMDVPDIAGMTEDERDKLALIRRDESGGKNVMNYVGRAQGLDPRTPKGATAQGYYQMLNSNWAKIAPLYNIKAPNAMAATDAEQTQVALHLLRHGGIGNWSNFNPKLREDLRRGVHVNPAGALRHRPLGANATGYDPRGDLEGGQRGNDIQIHNNTSITVSAPNPASAARQVADEQSRVHEHHIRHVKGALLA